MYLIVYALLGVCQSIAIMVHLQCCYLPAFHCHKHNLLLPGCYNSLLRLHTGRSKKVAQHNAVADHERTNVILRNNPTGKDSEQVDGLCQLLTL